MVENLYLIIETCTTEASIALFRGNRLLGERVSCFPKSHSEYINQAISELIKSSGFEYHDLNFIAVDQGPGSFTGIRVGLGVAKTLAYSLRIPIVSFHSNLALAATVPQDGEIVTMINAFKNMVFLGIYQKSGNEIQEILPPSLVEVRQVEKYVSTGSIVCGDGLKFYPQLAPLFQQQEMSETIVFPKASAMHSIVHKDFQNNNTKVWNSTLPLYLKASEAEENLKKGLLKVGR